MAVYGVESAELGPGLLGVRVLHAVEDVYGLLPGVAGRGGVGGGRTGGAGLAEYVRGQVECAYLTELTSGQPVISDGSVMIAQLTSRTCRTATSYPGAVSLACFARACMGMGRRTV